MDNILPDIHFLIKFIADESNYGIYPPNIIYSCHKLNDIYYTYCMARMNLEFYNNKDFGDFASDTTSIDFIKPQFLMNALNHYNILIDLSWQLIWFYIRTDLNQVLPTNLVYEEIAKECNEHTLAYYLTLAQENKLREYYLKNFSNNPATKKIREKWNFSKHRGIFHFDGMGYNPSMMGVSINKMMIPMVCRKELEIEVLKKELIDFDKEYFKYLNNLVLIIFPTNFTTYKNFSNSTLNYYFHWKEQIEALNKKIYST